MSCVSEAMETRLATKIENPSGSWFSLTRFTSNVQLPRILRRVEKNGYPSGLDDDVEPPDDASLLV